MQKHLYFSASIFPKMEHEERGQWRTELLGTLLNLFQCPVIHILFIPHLLLCKGFPDGSARKETIYHAGDTDVWAWFLGWEDLPGGANGNPLQYTWQKSHGQSLAIVHKGHKKSRTWLSMTVLPCHAQGLFPSSDKITLWKALMTLNYSINHAGTSVNIPSI